MIAKRVPLVQICPVLVLSIITVAPANAQNLIEDLRDALRRDVEAAQLPAQFQALINFSALPGISAARFTIEGSGDADDADLSTIKLPWDRDILLDERPFDLFVETNVGYLRAEQQIIVAPPGTDLTEIESDWQIVTGLAGLGLSYPVTPSTRVRPIVRLSLAQMWNDAGFDGPLSGILDPITDDILFDWSLIGLGIGGALQIEHDEQVEDLELKLKATYTHSYLSVLDATDEALEVGTHADVLTALAEMSGSTGWRPLGHDLRWEFLLTSTALLGIEARALGFPFFVQIGSGLTLDFDKRKTEHLGIGISRIGLRGSVIGGKRVRGFSLGLRLGF